MGAFSISGGNKMQTKDYKEFSTHKLFYMINYYENEINRVRTIIKQSETDFKTQLPLLELLSSYKIKLNHLSALSINIAEIDEKRDQKIEELWEFLDFKYQIEQGILND